MKTIVELTSTDLEAGLIPWMAASASDTFKSVLTGWLGSKGITIDASATFEIDSSDNVTITITNAPVAPAVSVPGPITPVGLPTIPPISIISPAPPLIPTPTNDRARCDAFTRQFTFPAECAYHHGGSRIPEDVIAEDVPGDNGGLTKWGIDQYSHSTLDIKSLTMQNALDIYYAEWLEQKCNLLPTPLAECVHDTFESGGHPIQWLQQVLGVKEDGELGPVTIAAANAAPGKPTALAFLVRRDTYFNELADTVGHDAQFRQGWLNRNQNLRTYLGLA